MKQRIVPMKRLIPLLFCLWLFTGNASAATLNPLALVQQACAITKATWICSIGDSILMAQSLIEGGWQRVQNTLEGYAQSWTSDAAQTAGQVICTGSGATKKCLADYVNDSKNWLSTQPDAFFDKLYAAGSAFYLSNLLQKFEGNSTAQVDSPTWLADRALHIQPNVKAKYYQAYTEDVGRLKKETDLGKIVGNSNNLNPAPDPIKPDPFLAHVAELTRPPCDPASPVGCLNPADPSGGWIAKFKSRAQTAVSSREELQTLVELQAEAQGNEAQNTLELSTRLRQMTQAQIYTNQELQMIYEALTHDQKQKQLEYQASLEAEFGKALASGQQGAAYFSSASQMTFNNANPDNVLNTLDGF